MGIMRKVHIICDKIFDSENFCMGTAVRTGGDKSHQCYDISESDGRVMTWSRPRTSEVEFKDAVLLIAAFTEEIRHC